MWTPTLHFTTINDYTVTKRGQLKKLLNEQSLDCEYITLTTTQRTEGTKKRLLKLTRGQIWRHQKLSFWEKEISGLKRSHHLHLPTSKSTKRLQSEALIVLPEPHICPHLPTSTWALRWGSWCSKIKYGNFAMEFKAKPAGLKAQHRPYYDLTECETFMIIWHDNRLHRDPRMHACA